MKFRVRGASWAAALALAAAGGCGRGDAPAAGDPGRAKIVSSLPRTGSAAAQTGTIVNGIRLALEEAGGRAGSLRVDYEDWDDASPQRGDWDAAVEAANADRAVRDPDVVVYIGTYNSGAAKVSIPKLNAASIAMISPANTYPGFTKAGLGEPNEPAVYRPSGRVNFFRVVPTDDLQGVRGAEWVRKLGGTSVYVLHDRELYGKGIADIFKAHAGKIGLKVLGYEGIDSRAANYRSLAAKIAGLGPDWVYFGGTTQSNGGQLVKDLRAAGFRGRILVPDGCVENAFIASAGAANAEGLVHATFGGLPPERLSGRGAEFYRRYRERFGAEPEVYAVYGYEGALVALDAIRRAGRKDRAAILEAVARTRDFEGALGRWSFDENGDITLGTMSGFVVRDGAWSFLEILGGS
jgi:branched-chain amino acid transport system substrate-binding protein